MTSRVSFVKKYHLTPILILAIACMIHFITVFMSLENILDRASFPFEEYTVRQLVGLYSPHIANGIFALAAGAYMAFDYFKYLHSRKETDFYESLPITKSKRFFDNFVSGFSVYAIFILITLSVELLVGKMLGIELSLIASKVIWNYICMLGIYLVSWVTAVLAMVMTGLPLIAILGYGTFSVYIPILLYNLIPLFSNIYFDNYECLPTFANFDIWSLFNYMSPAGIMYKTTSFYTDFWEASGHKTPLIVIILFTIFVGVLAFYLFKKRPSEAAGRAIAFEKANSYIRILIVIPLSLYLGVFLKSMSSSDSDLWLVFGILFAGFICHGLIQGIFEADIKAIFSKKKQLLLTYVICFGFLSIFKFDLLQFDEFVPKLNKVDKIYIQTDDFSDFLNMDYSDGISGSDLELALKAASEIIDSNKGVNNTSILFKYQLKNGVTVTRNYIFPIENVPKSLDELSVKQSFKDDYCMFYKKDLSEFNSVSYTYDHENYINITGNDLKELAHAYVDEFTKMTFTELYNEPVLYRFYAYYNDESDIEIAVTSSSPAIYLEEHQSVTCFDVPASFESTIKILNRLGYKSFDENEELEIVSLEVYADEEIYSDKTITDSELLAKLKKYAYLSEFNRHYNDMDLIYGWANVKSKSGEFHCDLYFEKDAFLEIMK